MLLEQKSTWWNRAKKNNKVEWGGECSNKEFSLDELKGIIAGFVKILYKKFGEQKGEQAAVKLSDYKQKKKKKNNCCQ